MTNDPNRRNHILDTTTAETMEIDGDWLISDLETIEDCNDAFAVLTAAVAYIEYSIELDSIKPDGQQNKEWAAKAKMALRYKKAALQLLTYKRGSISRKREESPHKVLVDYIRKSVTPKQFQLWLVAAGVVPEVL